MAAKDNIHAAVKVDDRKEVKRILEQKKDAVNKRDATEQTPLHVAAMEGHIDTMCLLLKKNANVNSQDKNCWTPLHCAAFSNHLQAMEILLDQGADVNIPNNEGSTPLHYLVRQKVLKEDKKLFNAVLEKMVEKKADVNMQNVHGYSPLHQACFRQRKWNAKRLLFYKANINIKTRRGETPLYFATRAGALELVKFLLMHGADPNIRSEDGSAKDVAAKHSNKELAEILSNTQLLVPKDNTKAYALPAPLTEYIFSFLDAKSLVSCSRVCSSWKVLAKDNALWKKQYVAKFAKVRPKYKDDIKNWRDVYASAARWARPDFLTSSPLPGVRGSLAALQLDEKRLLTAAGELKLWDANTLQTTLTIKVGGPFLCARFDETRIVAGDDKMVKLFDVRTGNVVKTFSGHSGKVVRVHVEEMRVVSAGLDEKLLVWDLLTGTLQKTLNNGAPIKSLHVEKDKLAVGSVMQRTNQHVLKLWNIRTGALTKTQSNFYANCIQFDKTRLIGAKEGRLKVWDLKTGGCTRTLRGHPAAVTCASMTDELVLSGDESGVLHVTHLSSGNCWRTAQMHDKPIVALQANSRMMVTASIDQVKINTFKWPLLPAQPPAPPAAASAGNK